MTIYQDQTNISVEFLERQLAQLKRDSKQETDMASKQIGGSGSNIGSGQDDGRIGRLEGAVEGLRHNQSIMLGAIGLVLTVLIGFSIYGLNRLDQLNSRVGELPGKISSDLRDIAGTLSQAITASKQIPPQVIMVPSPQPSNSTAANPANGR